MSFPAVWVGWSKAFAMFLCEGETPSCFTPIGSEACRLTQIVGSYTLLCVAEDLLLRFLEQRIQGVVPVEALMFLGQLPKWVHDVTLCEGVGYLVDQAEPSSHIRSV